MLGFEKDYPDAKKVILNTNYRCSAEIVDSAEHLISHNTKRFPKNMQAARGKKVPITFRYLKDAGEECTDILKGIRFYHKKGIPLEEMAVIFRTNTQPRLLVGRLMEYNIPFQMRDVIPNIFDHWIARNILTYIKIAMGNKDRKLFLQIMNRPKRYISFLAGRDFMEVETPMLVSNAGGAAARPFETHYNALNEDVKLRISLELYLKRLIVGGLERVYEIGRVFRNEGLDTRHNPEFTLMELYQAYTDYHGMMDLTENLYRYIAKEVTGSEVLTYDEHTMDLSKPFERITMVDAVKKYANVDFNEVADTAAAKKLADEHHIEYEDRHEKGDILNLFFEEYVEEHLIQPTFIMDHPIEISPLTKKKPDNPDYVERFEFFMNGWEMANAYSELNDPIDQRERFEAQEKAFEAGDDEANHTDEDFLNALSIGMPPTGGIGFGIDRMVMMMTNSPAIRDVLLFPTMKSLDK